MQQYKYSIYEKCIFPIPERTIARVEDPVLRNNLMSYVQSDMIERLEFVGKLIRLTTAEHVLSTDGFYKLNQRVKPRSSDREGEIHIWKRTINTDEDVARALKRSMYNADAFVSLRWRTIDGERYVATEYVRGSIALNPLRGLIHVPYRKFCLEFTANVLKNRDSKKRDLTKYECVRLGQAIGPHVIGPRPWPYANVEPKFKAEWDEDIQRNKNIIACVFTAWPNPAANPWVAHDGEPWICGPQ